MRFSHCDAFAYGSYAQGYAGPGFGNSSGDRKLKVHLGYHTLAPTDSVTQAIANTTRIELCRITSGGSITCPGTAPWLVYDANGGIGEIKASDVFTDATVLQPRVAIDLPLDWDDPSAAKRIVYVKVNGGEATALADVQRNGGCANWRELATSASDRRFDVYGVTADASPWPWAIDACTDLSAFWWRPPYGAHTGAPPNVCISAAQAEHMRQSLISLDDAQFQRIQRALVVQDRHQAWRNGSAGGTFLPTHVLLGPHWVFGQSGSGSFWVNPDDIRNIIPGQPPATALPGATRDTLRIVPHEYFHQLQLAWGREEPPAHAHINDFISEGLTTSTELNICHLDYPNAPPGECVSGGKLGLTTTGIYGSARAMAKKAQKNVLEEKYHAATFWRYVQEQFSYPVDATKATHPSGTNSTIPRAGLANFLTLAQRPFSDEGIDFVGLLFQHFATAPPTKSTYALIHQVLTDRLGRGLDDVVFDLHTAFFLKDYTDTDDRWRFDWVHGDGYQATTLLSDGKPFRVPNDLYGATCDATQSICDGLLRFERVLDSWETACGGACPAIRDLLPLGQGIASTQPVGIERYGTAAMSVSPDPAWAGSNLAVRVNVLSGHPLPRFRIFHVIQGGIGGTNLIPLPVCGDAPYYECKLSMGASSAGYGLNVNVPMAAGTREVLLIASGRGDAAKFDWSFGQINPQVHLVEPTTSHPAFVGSGTGLRRSFVIKLRAHDEDQLPLMGLKKSDLTINVPGCAAASGCTLSEDDFSWLPLSGGNIIAVATLPVSFYPAAPSGSLDLEVSLAGVPQPAFETAALSYDGAGRTDATAFVLDRSGSMGDFGGTKLQAAQIVLKALYRSLLPVETSDPPSSQAALIAFALDADTPMGLSDVTYANLAWFDPVVDSLTAAGWTSIGDGALEAQSVLATAFDPPGATVPDAQSMIVVSDGLNTDPAIPEDYYASSAPPTGDGNGSWYAGPLSIRARDDAGRSLPVVSTVAIGQDADLTQLDLLAKAGNGTRIYLPGPEATTTLLSATLDFGDAFSGALTESHDYDRIAAERRPAQAPPTTISVEHGAAELRVLLISSELRGGLATLTAPSGQIHSPISIDPTTNRSYAAYRIRDPESGTWTLQGDAPTFVEATVRSRVQLFTFAEAAQKNPIQQGGSSDPSTWIGADVWLRAIPFEHQAVTACQVHAEILAPGASTPLTLVLQDDGKSQDASAADGAYGAVFTKTGIAGLYDVLFKASCVSPVSGAPFVREARTGFYLKPVTDSDGDGAPDYWEGFYGLNTASAAPVDTDGDGLTDADEFALGTNPLASDSDRGGESDASERARGSDPRREEDDGADAPRPRPIPGRRMVLLPLAMNPTGATLQVERAVRDTGPFVPIGVTHAPGSWFAVDETVIEGEPACYRVRATTSGATSAWSPPACVTPALDPHPPHVQVRYAPAVTSTRSIELRLAVEDDNEGIAHPVALDTVSSGSREVRIWYGTGPADTPWQPALPSVALRLPDQNATVINVQARDLAGNLGESERVVVLRPQRRLVDRMIALDERAQDELDAGYSQQASSTLAESIDAHEKLLGFMYPAMSTGTNQKLATQAVGKLLDALALKSKAKAQSKPNSLATAKVDLDQAVAILVKLANEALPASVLP